MAKMATNNHLEKNEIKKNPLLEFFSSFLHWFKYGLDYQEPQKKVEYS